MRMDEAVFKGIANEIKGLNNQAANLISQGKLNEAEDICQRALKMTGSLSFYEGMAMFLYNLANIETLKNDLLQAITYGALCKEMHEKAQTDAEYCDKLLLKLAKAAMKKGIEHEKNGRLEEALEYYYAGAPFAEEKYRQAMLKEIELIERLRSNG